MSPDLFAAFVASVLTSSIIGFLAASWLWRQRLRNYRNSWRTKARRLRAFSQDEYVARENDSRADGVQFLLEWYFNEGPEPTGSGSKEIK